jgi:hypothetical protein
MEQNVSTLKSLPWQKILPWLALIVAAVFLAWPMPWLKVGLNAITNSIETSQPGFGSDFGTSKLVAESTHFRILAYEKYANQKEAEIFLENAEKMYPKLAKFLGVPLGDHPITIVLLPQCDVSHGGINFLTVNTCNRRLQPIDSYIFIHELTHVLMNSQYTALTNSLFGEGMAVTAGKRFEWGVPFIFDMEMYLYESFRTGQFIPLSELQLGVSYTSSTSGQQYAEAGSFTSYLINKYGVEKFLVLYKSGDDFEGIYNVSFEQLANGWLQSLRVGNLMQALILIAGGVVVLWLIYLAIMHGWKWIPAALIGWLAFLLWSFLLGTSDAMSLLYVIIYRSAGVPPPPYEVIYPIWAPAGLILAALLGAILSRWKKLAGKIVLWLAGVGPMIGFLLIPAIALFFK